MTAINGLIPGDYLAAVGVLRALDLADERALLRWQGTQPHFTTNLGIDEIVGHLVDVRKDFHGVWPAELNKLSDNQCDELLLASEEPFRSLVVALISAGGRSEMVCLGRTRRLQGDLRMVNKPADEGIFAR